MFTFLEMLALLVFESHSDSLDNPFVCADRPFRTACFMNKNKNNLGWAPSRDPTTTILAPWLSATPCSMYEKKRTSKSLSLPELELFQKFTIPLENLQFHWMCASPRMPHTLGEIFAHAQSLDFKNRNS